jgi:hypothetical protein
MALTIQNYLQPGAYSTIIPNPTVPTAGGIPVVAIVGQALQGPYTPQIFTNSFDAVTTYGTVTKSNPLALGISLAFQNGAPRVLGVNVQPDNSTPCYLSIPITGPNGLPTAPYSAAPPKALDAVTGLPVNTNGAIAGSFYIQDFNPVIPDPVLNSSSTVIQAAFSSGSNSLLQYYGQLNGTSSVPLQQTQQQQIIVYTVETSTPPVTSIAQSGWNQLNNANALLDAFNGAFQSPVAASILIPDSSPTQAGYNPIPGYRELYGSVGQTINVGSTNPLEITSLTDAYLYALYGVTVATAPASGVASTTGGGIVYVYSLEPGTQHCIIYGLFDSNSASSSSTEGVAFGLPVYTSISNPFGALAGGTDGVVTTNSYTQAIGLLGGQRADIIVCLNTDPGLQSTLKSHVTLQSSTAYRNERIALVSGPISELYTTTIQNVTNLQGGAGAERMMYIFPTATYIYDAVLRTTVVVDGTYLACACAGIMASHDAAEPLTHKILSGFRDISIKLDNPTANLVAQYGVCIIENNPTYGIRVRDQLTCDPSTPETQEISVVRQLDFTAQTLRDVMDANVVATKIVASTLGVVTSLATTQMQGLVNNSIIYGYQGLVTRINPNDPRQIDLMVSVRPAYPCKWVQITISVTSSLEGF